ncbi:MAG TPA: ABC transporter permease [bacterium]|nr:ABC transporter permease [bacterium]
MMRSPVLRGLLPTLPLLAFLLVFFLYPVGQMLSFSISPEGGGLAHYRELLTTPLYRRVMWETLQISVVVTLLCLALGYPVAYTLTMAPPRVANLLLILVVTPFWISILARSFTWMILLQRDGVVNQVLLGLHLVRAPVSLIYNQIGVYIGMVHVLLPFMILSLYGVMRGIDTSLLRAASNLGATEWQAFRRVFFPLSLPGVAAGCLMLFVVGLGFFITPALLGGGKVTTVSMLIEAYINQALDWGLAAALSLVLLVATVLVIALYSRAMNLDRLFGGGT